MPDGLPPFMNSDSDGFDSEADLDRLARLIYARRAGVVLSDLDTWFEANPSELDVLESIKDSFTRVPTWLDSGVRVFDVTESPEGEFVDRHGNRYAVVRSYALHYVPNNPKRRTIAPWAAFGQR